MIKSLAWTIIRSRSEFDSGPSVARCVESFCLVRWIQLYKVNFSEKLLFFILNFIVAVSAIDADH